MGNDFEIKDGILLKYHGNAERVQLPENIVVVGERAFAKCSSLKEIIFSPNLKGIAPTAFFQCTNLKRVQWLDKKQKGELSWGAFIMCISLESITLPDIEYLPQMAFAHCEKLKDFAIYSESPKLEFDAFTGCYNLQTVHCTQFSELDLYFSVLRKGITVDYIAECSNIEKVSELVLSKASENSVIRKQMKDSIDDLMEAHLIMRQLRMSSGLEEVINKRTEEFYQRDLTQEEITADNLRIARLALGMEVPELAQEAHVPETFIYQYENKKGKEILAHKEYLTLLTQYLGMTKEQLFTKGYSFSYLSGKDLQEMRIR